MKKIFQNKQSSINIYVQLKSLKNLAYHIVIFLMISYTQVISQSSNKDLVQIKGSTQLSFNTYNASGIKPRQGKYGYGLLLNANLKIASLNIPIYASINQRGDQFRNPFNRYGFSTKYKSLQVHLGWRNMHFTNYSLSGVSFFGAGFSINPGLLRFSAMYGKIPRFNRTFGQSNNTMLKSRDAMAFKIGLGSQNNYIDLTLFSAKDPIGTSDTTLTKPQENLVIALDSKFPLIGQNFNAYVDGTISLFTENRLANSELLNDIDYPESIDFFFKPNISTHVNYAIEAGAILNLSRFNLKGSFRRIMPEYKSLGLNYLRNDLQAVLLNPSLSVLNNRIHLSVSAGYEKNNLDDLRSNNQTRLISSAQLRLLNSKGSNLILNYSNYSFNNQLTQDSLITDSVTIKQVNKNMSATLNWVMANTYHNQFISVNIVKQNSEELILGLSNVETILISGNYSLSKKGSKLKLGFGSNYFILNFNDTNEKKIGLNIKLSMRNKSKGLDYSIRSSWLKTLNSDKQSINIYGRFRKKMSRGISLELQSSLRLGIAESNSQREIQSSIKLRKTF